LTPRTLEPAVNIGILALATDRSVTVREDQTLEFGADVGGCRRGGRFLGGEAVWSRIRSARRIRRYG